MGEKSDLTNMRIFGCKAYAKELGVLKKLDERNKKLILVGYRLWNPEKRKIEIRRDVTFNENIDRKTQKKEKKGRHLKTRTKRKQKMKNMKMNR